MIPVRLLASVIGHIVSTQAVCKSVRLRTRYAYDCILARLSWDSPIWLGKQNLNSDSGWKIEKR